MDISLYSHVHLDWTFINKVFVFNNTYIHSLEQNSKVGQDSRISQCY
jgi:hypothetical protein